MKKANKTQHLVPREKCHPTSPTVIGLQGRCNDMWLNLLVNKAKLYK